MLLVVNIVIVLITCVVRRCYYSFSYAVLITIAEAQEADEILVYTGGGQVESNYVRADPN